jgi:hypothetical protein
MSQQIRELENQLTPEDRLEVKKRVESKLQIISRHKVFTEWLNRIIQAKANGANAATLQATIPPPHTLDDYELRRAVEEGLY